MKKIYKFTLIPFVLGLMAMMFACTNLDETVYDTIPADQFGKKQAEINAIIAPIYKTCLLYTSPSPRDRQKSRMPSSA